ncbi:hypothetical protein E6H32_07475 [Candidatus Bathyarchaeota archaeon]|nr:MAG: hypothetical protein E6H32_07475 [Candidatus Bathyarchaeota archaeon]
MTLLAPTETGLPENVFQDFFRAYLADPVGSKYRKRLAEVAVNNGRSLVIDFDDLIAFDPVLARNVVQHPDDFFVHASSAATSQMRVEDPEYAEQVGRIIVRFRRLPEKRALRKIGAEDLMKLALVEGIVVRTSQVRPMIVKAVFRCRKCGELSRQDQAGDLLRGPGPICASCKQQSGWDLIEDQCVFKNTQEARVQERPEDLPPGMLPRYLDVRLDDDLVDTARPGDRVALTSVVRAEKQYAGEKGKLRTFNLYLEANFVDVVGKETEIVEITLEDEKKIIEASKHPFVHRNLIMSLAPSIYGYDEIKEGILYLLFAGVAKRLPDGVNIRGDLNCLIVGDPGCLIGDERVVLGDGTVAKIEDLGDHHLENLNIPVLTGGGGAEKDIATRFHIYHNQPTMEIVTESGKSIRGTYNHPLLSVEIVERTQIRRWKRLDEFRVGDRVAVVTGFPCYITGLVHTGWHPLPYTLGPKFRGRLPTKVTPELGSFMGYVLGDGWVERYRAGFTVADGEKDVLKTLCAMSIRLFGITPKVSSRKGPNRNVQLFEGVIHSQDVAYNLATLKEKRIPDLILKSGDSVVSPFLRWLYEADGTVFSSKRGCGAIGLKAKNIELLRDVQILLLRFGIHSRIISNALLIRRGESILKFADKIGFASVKKQTRLADLRARAARLKRFGRQHSERIVAVYHREPADVYDIEVPQSHKFVANGIVSHNTAKSQLLQYVSRIAPRGLYTSGRGTTAAGLTAAVLREKTGGMVLEAGALVLADKGVACLHPDSEVFVDGVQRRVADLFDEGRIERALSGSNRLELSPLHQSVANLDLDRLVTRQATATLVARRWYSGQILRVRMESGMELRLTSAHPVLDGKTLQWKPIGDFRPGDNIVALKKLPSSRTRVLLLDILPDDWIVQPLSSEKVELRRVLEAKHTSLRAINSYYGLKRDALNGRGALTIRQFKAILKDTGMYNAWAQRPFAFGRKKRTERLKIGTLTADLAYILGFAYGKGCVRSSAKHSALRITQSSVHADYIRRLQRAMHQVSHRPWNTYLLPARTTKFAKSSECQVLVRHSNLVVHLFEWLTRNGLQNLLRLNDAALAGFLAGAVDADGCFSIKKNRQYSMVSFDLLLSNDLASNRRLLWALRRFDVYARIKSLHGVMSIQITSRRDVRRLMDRISLYSGKAKNIPPQRTRISARHEAVPALPLRVALSGLRPVPIELLRSGDWSTFHSYRNGKRQPYKAPLQRLIRGLHTWLDASSRERLLALAGDDYALDAIRTVNSEFYTGYVYDLRVPLGEHFVTEGVLTHNCIDELDKMRPDDRVAIHEALEQQTVSVAKGGIVATLNARAAVLAAANPSLGRYEPHRNINENINLPVTILSRFDLIFLVKDLPDPDSDSEMSSHILQLHRARHGSEEAPFQPDFLRKYISYAKRIIPVLTPDAVKELQDFYLKMRGTTGREAAVAITPRQLEALVRLSEARARAFLRDQVTVEDAKSAVKIMTYALLDVGVDVKTGKIDIDTIMTGRPATVRDTLGRVIDIVRELERETGDVDEKILIAAIVDKNKVTDGEARRFVGQLIKEGMLYSPKEGRLKRTSS